MVKLNESELDRVRSEAVSFAASLEGIGPRQRWEGKFIYEHPESKGEPYQAPFKGAIRDRKLIDRVKRSVYAGLAILAVGGTIDTINGNPSSAQTKEASNIRNGQYAIENFLDTKLRGFGYGDELVAAGVDTSKYFPALREEARTLEAKADSLVGTPEAKADIEEEWKNTKRSFFGFLGTLALGFSNFYGAKGVKRLSKRRRRKELSDLTSEESVESFMDRYHYTLFQ